tara:strand:+ start:501 stop:698 length:198 start_codon:yes stop_codon:yes gene_type:complete
VKHNEQDIKSAKKLINKPLTIPNKYPDINKQYVPGRTGIAILIKRNNIITNIPQLPDKASTTTFK